MDRQSKLAPITRLSTALLLLACVAGASEGPSAGEVRPRAAACFAPGTPDRVVEEIADRLAGQALSLAASATSFTFDDDDRWSFTATDGGGLGQGDPTTLTWSYIPDGTSICGYIGEPTADSELFAWLDSIYGDFATWHAIFVDVFDRWSELTGMTYVYEPNDDGAPFSCTSLPNGVLGVRGDVRIGAHPIDGDSGVLAYNFFPNSGDMVIESSDAFYDDTTSESLRLRNVLAHEHGHGLGLAHACPIDRTKLMEPFVSTAFDGPQHDDVLAVNRGYGDPAEPDDTVATATDLGLLTPGTTIAIAGRSIDDDLDTDVVSFDVAGTVETWITVAPVGSTYLSGPQNGNGSCSPGASFDSLSIHDLAIELLDTDGATVLASADAVGAGRSEEIAAHVLSAPGTYFVRVTGDSSDAAQLFDATIAGLSNADPSLELIATVTPASGPHPVASDIDAILTARNIGNGAADLVTIATCLDPALDASQLLIFDGGQLNVPPAPAGCTEDWVSWSIGTLNPGGAADVRYSATIPLGTADASIISTGGVVSSAQTTPVPSNTIDATVCAPELVVSLAANGAGYGEGDPIVWTLTASNSHPSCAVTAVSLSDVLDLAFVEDQPTLTWTTPPGGTSGKTGDTIRWSLAPIGPGASEVIQVSSEVRTGVSGNFCSQADGSWAESAGLARSQSCADVTSGCPAGGVPAVADLSITSLAGDVHLSWTPLGLAEEYDVWRIADDASAITSAGRGVGGSVTPVSGCADPNPTATAACTDTDATATGVVYYYQVRGLCGGTEGAL